MGIAAIALLVSLNSVALEPGKQSEGFAAGDTATRSHLVIYRPKQNAVYGSINFRIIVNGKILGKLKGKMYYSVELSPGEHIISVNDKTRTRQKISIEDHEIVVIQGKVNRKHTLVMRRVNAIEAVQDAPFLAEVLGVEDEKSFVQR